MSFSQELQSGKRRWFEIIVNGCNDCPCKINSVPNSYCFITKKKIDNKELNIKRLDNCPLPISQGFIEIQAHGYSDKMKEK